MLHNDSCYVNGLYFDKKGLLERCLEIYWFKFSFNLLIGILLFLSTHLNMFSVAFVRWIVIVVFVVNVIILKRIHNIVLRIERIFNNAKIIESNVLRDMSYLKVSRSLFVGSYHIYSVYFDDSTGASILFRFKGHIDRPVHITKPFKQGEDWIDLETINVLVNADDYTDYFVLFREELNIDTSRRRSYGPTSPIDYILWYGAVIFLIFYTR